MIPHHLSEPVKHIADMLSVGTIVAALLSWLPPIGAALSVVWIALRVRTQLLEHRIAEQEFQLNARKLKE